MIGIIAKLKKISILKKLLADQPLPGPELRDAAKNLKKAAEWLEESADLGEESIPTAIRAVTDLVGGVDAEWCRYLNDAVAHAKETDMLRRYLKELEAHEATL